MLEHLTILPDAIPIGKANEIYQTDVAGHLHENVNRTLDFEGARMRHELKSLMSSTTRSMWQVSEPFAERCSSDTLACRPLLPNLKSLHIGPTIDGSNPSEQLHYDKWVSPGLHNSVTLLDDQRYLYESRHVGKYIERSRPINGKILSHLIKSVPSTCVKTMRVPSNLTTLAIPHDTSELIENHALDISVFGLDMGEFLIGNAYGTQESTPLFGYERREEGGLVRQTLTRHVSEPVDEEDEEADVSIFPF